MPKKRWKKVLVLEHNSTHWLIKCNRNHHQRHNRTHHQRQEKLCLRYAVGNPWYVRTRTIFVYLYHLTKKRAQPEPDNAKPNVTRYQQSPKPLTTSKYKINVYSIYILEMNEEPIRSKSTREGTAFWSSGRWASRKQLKWDTADKTLIHKAISPTSNRTKHKRKIW